MARLAREPFVRAAQRETVCPRDRKRCTGHALGVWRLRICAPLRPLWTSSVRWHAAQSVASRETLLGVTRAASGAAVHAEQREARLRVSNVVCFPRGRRVAGAAGRAERAGVRVVARVAAATELRRRL